MASRGWSRSPSLCRQLPATCRTGDRRCGSPASARRHSRSAAARRIAEQSRWSPLAATLWPAVAFWACSLTCGALLRRARRLARESWSGPCASLVVLGPVEPSRSGSKQATFAAKKTRRHTFGFVAARRCWSCVPTAPGTPLAAGSARARAGILQQPGAPNPGDPRIAAMLS